MSKKKPGPLALLDIVIPVYNAFDHLWNCLDALPDAVGDVKAKVVIYDDGSEKEAADEFYANISGAKIIRNRQNRGFPAAVNNAVRQCASPLILILNSDVVMQPGSIAEMVKAMDDPEVGVCGAKLLFPDDTPHGPAGKIQHAGLTVTIKAEVKHAFITWSPDNPRVLRVRDVFAVTGACMMTRRSHWRRLGGFYEGYGRGTWEEVDYQMAISKQLGKKIVVEQNAVGTHFVGASVLENQVGFNIAQNRSLFLSRWGNELVWDQWRIL